MTILLGFSFHLHIHLSFPTFARCWHCSSMLYRVSDLHSLKAILFHQNFLNTILVSLLYCLLPILTTLIVSRPVLLLILIMLVSLCVCFKLMWSVSSFLTFCLLTPNLVSFFECQLGRHWKLPHREKPQISIVLVLPPMFPIPLVPIYTVYWLIKSWSRSSVMLYYDSPIRLND